MSTIHTNAGSFYPDKSILDYQLKPSYQAPQEMDSAIFKGKILLSGNTCADLPRLGTLIVNGEKIYKKPEYLAIDGNVSILDKDAAKVNYIFNRLETKLDSTTLAIRAAGLMEQNLGGEVLKQVAKEKGLSTGSDTNIYSTHAVTAKKSASVLTTSGKTFKLIHEDIVQKTDMQDFENNSFFKVKTVVKGPLSALESGSSEGMSIQTVYSKEQASMQEAYKENYSFFDRESYLKA